MHGSELAAAAIFVFSIPHARCGVLMFCAMRMSPGRQSAGHTKLTGLHNSACIAQRKCLRACRIGIQSRYSYLIHHGQCTAHVFRLPTTASSSAAPCPMWTDNGLCNLHVLQLLRPAPHIAICNMQTGHGLCNVHVSQLKTIAPSINAGIICVDAVMPLVCMVGTLQAEVEAHWDA